MNEFHVSRFQIERTTKSMFIRLIYVFYHSQICGIFVIKGDNCKLETECFIVENN
jgi:hypothetical protein